MNAPSVDIADMLEAESSLNLTIGTNLFVGNEPAKPADCVTIFDTIGMPPQLTMDAAMYEYPSVQIRVRNTDYRTGWELISDIMTLLHGQAQETWNGTLYSVIYVSSGPMFLDWDDNNHVRFVVNLNIQRR